MRHGDVRMVREGQQSFEGPGLKFLVQLHALFKAFFHVDEHHRRDGPERTRAGNGDVERFLSPGHFPHVLAGGGPVLRRCGGNQGDVGWNDIGHRVTEGSAPFLEFAGDLRREAEDDANTHGVTVAAVSAGNTRLARVVRTDTLAGVGLDVELASGAHGVSGLPGRGGHLRGRAGSRPWNRRPRELLKQCHAPCLRRGPGGGRVPRDRPGARWPAPG